MKKRKKILTFLCILSFIGAIESVDAQSDPEAEKILKEVSLKYKSFTSIKALFIIEIENSSAKTKETQKGTIYLKGQKYKLEIAGQEIYCDGKTISTYLKDANELQINEYSEEEGGITPNNIFTVYEKDFLYRFLKEETQKGKPVQIVELTPNDKTKKVFKIRITIDKHDKVITQSMMFEKNGNHTTYSIEKFTPNTPMNDTFFSFNKSNHPGVEIVDLR